MSRLIRPYRTDRLLVAAALVITATMVGAPSAHAVVHASAKPPRTVVAVTFEPDSALYRIRPRTGRSTKIGRTGVELTDVANRGTALYAIGFGALYRLDASTGTATLVGPLGVTDANALTVRPRSRALFGAGKHGELFRINQHTGATKVLGRFGHHLGSEGDLAFIGTRLYAAVFRLGSSTATMLARVNVRTGKATVIGPTGFDDVNSLVAAKGHLYGGTGQGTLLRISTRTGLGHELSKTHLVLGGLAS